MLTAITPLLFLDHLSKFATIPKSLFPFEMFHLNFQMGNNKFS